MVRVKPYGSAKYAKYSCALDRLRSLTVLIVAEQRGASPENILPRLAPPAASSPPPSERRRSSSAASFWWFETIVRPLSFSYQRKAGMSWLLPRSRPAWLAPVWEERSHSQGMTWWLA
jgi:hypothetical protein